MGFRMRVGRLAAIVVGMGATAWLTACRDAQVAGGTDRGAAVSNNVGCLTTFDATIDYFPVKTTLEFARNFSVEHRKSYKVVTVHSSSSEPGITEKYVLVQCGAPAPALMGELTGAPVIQIPIASMFALSLTHVPLLANLGRTDVLTGIG